MSKTILVTGSSRGIGKAVALLAAEKGYKVIVHGSRDSDELDEVHKAIEGSVKTFFDVTDREAVHDKVSKLGTIDILINNAGMGRAGIKDVADVKDEDAIREYEVNVLGTLHCIQAVIPKMLEKGSGVVVNIASIKGHYNLTSLSSLTYGTTKAGVIALTRALAKAYPQIRFNTVSPGYVQTDMSKQWPPETFDRIKNETLAGRIAQPDEIAGAVLYLASDEAGYITGSDILIDGGFSIKGK